MTTSGETLYTFRDWGPDILQLGRQNTVALRGYHNGAEVTPALWTFSLLNPAGTEIASANGAAAVASATVEALELPTTLTPEGGYQEVWTWQPTAGPTITWDREAAVALRPPYPVITDDDLIAVYPDMAAIRGTLTHNQGHIDEAWKRIATRWINEGRLTYQLKSRGALRLPHLELTFELFFRYLAKNQPGRGNYNELADHHKNAYREAWRVMTYSLDLDNDGRVDDPNRREGRKNLHPNAAPSSSLRRDSRW